MKRMKYNLKDLIKMNNLLKEQLIKKQLFIFMKLQNKVKMFKENTLSVTLKE